jgi:hypothetical protein
MTESSGATTMPDEHDGSGEVVARLSERLDKALDVLGDAKAFARSVYQTDVFQVAEALMASKEGLQAIYERAHRFETVGVFAAGAWEDASKLLPPLVGGSLRASGVYPVVETLSELRMLAIATGRGTSKTITAEEARAFLDETMALNLEFVFPGDTEVERIEGGVQRSSNIRLFQLIAHEIGLGELRREVLREIQQVCAQRPIMTGRVRHMIDMVSRLSGDGADEDVQRELEVYAAAVHNPTPLSQKLPRLADYRGALAEQDFESLQAESRAFAASMKSTGLTSPHHAVLLRHARKECPELLPIALGLNDMGAAALAQDEALAHRLIKVAIQPSTAQAIYGLGRMLERGLLARGEVASGLERAIEIDLQTDVKRKLLRQRGKRDGVTANAVLLAGLVSVLGQPFGVGQGHNPTCQAARGIALWSRYAPGYLIELVLSAARDGLVQMPFEGQPLRSDELPPMPDLNADDLDPISLVLVPHLDRLYAEMLRLVALRPEDGHKWVNPAFYGRWVPTGFVSVFADLAQTTVSDYEDFVRRFYASHHPSYNEGHSLMYHNPVGLCITNGRGDHLGPHALSIQRVDEDPQGVLRVYFFNPNNEGRQDWGRDVRPSIQGHGEDEGESSLPFHQFASRLYAFHYNPYEVGDGYAVPDDTIAEVEREARATWGRAFHWLDGGA